MQLTLFFTVVLFALTTSQVTWAADHWTTSSRVLPTGIPQTSPLSSSPVLTNPTNTNTKTNTKTNTRNGTSSFPHSSSTPVSSLTSTPHLNSSLSQNTPTFSNPNITGSPSSVSPTSSLPTTTSSHNGGMSLTFGGNSGVYAAVALGAVGVVAAML